MPTADTRATPADNGGPTRRLERTLDRFYWLLRDTTVLTRLVPSGLRAPVAGLLHGRRRADVYPTVCRADTLPALSRLAAESGLTVARIELVESSAQLTLIRCWCSSSC